jgi:hypothetical protein
VHAQSRRCVLLTARETGGRSALLGLTLRVVARGSSLLRTAPGVVVGRVLSSALRRAVLVVRRSTLRMRLLLV